MKNVALTNCWCGFADGWDEALKKKGDLADIKGTRNGGYKSKLANSGYKSKHGCMNKTKATEAALFIGENEEILFLAFLGRLFRLYRWSFLLVWCRIELVCDEDDAVVLGALLINPFIWLEVALDSEHGSLLQLVERVNMLILAPCLHVHES